MLRVTKKYSQNITFGFFGAFGDGVDMVWEP